MKIARLTKQDRFIAAYADYIRELKLKAFKEGFKYTKNAILEAVNERKEWGPFPDTPHAIPDCVRREMKKMVRGLKVVPK